MPAQYHYQAATRGAEVIYLSGRDTALDGQSFPPHASRFWLYPGADAQGSQYAATTLELAYRLTWLHPAEQETREEVA